MAYEIADKNPVRLILQTLRLLKRGPIHMGFGNQLNRRDCLERCLTTIATILDNESFLASQKWALFNLNSLKPMSF